MLLTRRDVLSTAGAGFGLVIDGKPILARTSEIKPAGPNDRINVGFIGFGIRGNVLLEAVKRSQQANLICACDCYLGHLDRAKERTEGKIDVNYARYKELLARNDIDAVIIATPEHWHLQQFEDACAAGKDVYIEKPMTRTIDEGPKMIAAAERYGRVVQVGSQWISSPIQKQAKELLKSGAIGQVTKIMAFYNSNSTTSAWNYPIPSGIRDGVNFNWTEWLGPAPSREFDEDRAFRYLKYSEYSGGIATHLFVHLITSINFLMDATMPNSVMATGANFLHRDGRDVPDTLDALFEYPDFIVNMSSTMNNSGLSPQGINLLGTKGVLTITLGSSGMDLAGTTDMAESVSAFREPALEDYSYAVDSWPKELRDTFWQDMKNVQQAFPPVREIAASHVTPGPNAIDATVYHLTEFFECVRSKRQPNENATVGHRAAAAAHMVNLSQQSGKRMIWEAARESAREG